MAAGGSTVGDGGALLVSLAWSSAALVVLTVVLSVLSALLERSGTIRLRHWAREAGGSIVALYERPIRFEAFRFVLSWSAKLAPALLTGALLAVASQLGGALGRVWVAFAVLTLVLAFSELANRALVGHDPEAALRRLTPLYRGALLVAGPLVAVLAAVLPAAAVVRREEADEDEASDEEIEAFIRVGTREGILEPGEEDLVRGIVDFGDTPVRSVMTPRIDMVCAPLDSSLEDLVELFFSARHSRLPVYRDSVDHVVGTVHLRDVLSAVLVEGEAADPLAELVKPPYFVPETKHLGQLLREFQARHLQMAIVVDEYGGTAGLVTVVDLLEEIVGDIPDEDEDVLPATEALPDGAWRFDGRAQLDELEDVFGVDLEAAPYETVGGLIFGVIGDVPGEGQSVESFGLRLTVERVAERRVLSVLIRRQSDDVSSQAVGERSDE